jgi:hypothetical protein
MKKKFDLQGVNLLAKYIEAYQKHFASLILDMAAKAIVDNYIKTGQGKKTRSKSIKRKIEKHLHQKE